MDRADMRGGLEECIKQWIVVHAGKRIDRVNPVRDERGNNHFCGRHAVHGALARCLPRIARLTTPCLQESYQGKVLGLASARPNYKTTRPTRPVVTGKNR